MIRGIRRAVVVGTVAVLLSSAVAESADPAVSNMKPQTPFSASVTDSDAAAYAATFNVSLSEGRRRLEAQARAVDIVAQMQSALGRNYGGLWFDNGSGRFKVAAAAADAATRRSAKAAVDAVLTQMDVADTSDVVFVQNSWDELTAAHDALDAALAPAIAANEAQTGVDVIQNAVTVELAPTITPAHEALVTDATAGASVRTVVETGSALEFDVHANDYDCAFMTPSLFPFGQRYYPFCPWPLRSSVAMATTNPNSAYVYLCSVGYLAHGNTGGKPFVVTAGHCVQPTGDTWLTDVPNLGYEGFGARHSYTYGTGDSALVDQLNTYWDQPGFHAYAAIAGSTDYYAIIGRAWSYVGEAACHLGEHSYGVA